MSRQTFVLYNEKTRTEVLKLLTLAPRWTRVEVKAPRRTLPQNDKLHAMLTDVARQVDWFGQKYGVEDWKDYFGHALKGARWMPSEEGGMIPIGVRTSDLSKGEMSDMIELIHAFCAQNAVILHESEEVVG